MNAYAFTRATHHDHQTYVPTIQGEYFCSVTQNNCTVNSNVITAPFLSSSSFERNNKIKLFPNPATDEIAISFDGNYDGNYKVVNPLGQTVLSGTENANEKQIRISVSDLQAGHYVLQMKINGVSEKIKFVKR